MKIEIFKVKSFPFLIILNMFLDHLSCLNCTIEWNKIWGMKQIYKENLNYIWNRIKKIIQNSLKINFIKFYKIIYTLIFISSFFYFNSIPFYFFNSWLINITKSNFSNRFTQIFPHIILSSNRYLLHEFIYKTSYI